MFPLKDNIPTRRPPVLTIAIIGICVAMYFGFQSGGFSSPDEENVIRYAFIPAELSNPGDQCVPGASPECAPDAAQEERYDRSFVSVWLSLLFAMFMHGSVIHLGGNMLFLWIFGNNIEDSMGKHRFLAFYLLGGLVATLAQWAVDTDSTTPMLGASGAIAAVLGGYALLYPRARVITLIFIIIFVTVIELPALLVLGAWFLLQLADASSQPLSGGGVAYLAHIGGFVFGLLTIKLFADRIHDDYEYAGGGRLPVY